jgi:hypothetical protein
VTIPDDEQIRDALAFIERGYLGMSGDLTWTTDVLNALYRLVEFKRAAPDSAVVYQTLIGLTGMHGGGPLAILCSAAIGELAGTSWGIGAGVEREDLRPFVP